MFVLQYVASKDFRGALLGVFVDFWRIVRYSKNLWRGVAMCCMSVAGKTLVVHFGELAELYGRHG